MTDSSTIAIARQLLAYQHRLILNLRREGTNYPQ